MTENVKVKLLLQPPRRLCLYIQVLLRDRQEVCIADVTSCDCQVTCFYTKRNNIKTQPSRFEALLVDGKHVELYATMSSAKIWLV